VAETIIQFIEQHGVWGVALLMVLENLFPPIPSELIMPFAGFAAARGDLNAAAIAAAGIAGSVLGTLPWYWVGRRIGCRRLKRWADRHGRWLTVTPGDIDHAQRWFERHGSWSVALGRLVPAVRSVISAPAGITGMPLTRFLLWSTIGSTVWVGALTALGFLLEGQYEQVARWIDPVSKAMLAVCVAGYLYRVATFHRRASRGSRAT
jgi:membrane protein DedA with SNARE-associated domain